MIAAENPDADTVAAQRLPCFSIVVPTFNESENVGELVKQLTAAVPSEVSFEVLFADDSTDDTPATIGQIRPPERVSVRLLHRDRPVGGLGGAVLAGLREVLADRVVVIDGDLQHPPALVPVLLETLDRRHADIVVASRYLADGDPEGLANRYRRLVSQASTIASRALFPRRLRNVTDPMSGFFAIRRSSVDLDRLRPIGYKIMLEVLVRGRLEHAVEVPYRFGERYAGESKSSLREGLRFLRHLVVLRCDLRSSPDRYPPGGTGRHVPWSGVTDLPRCDGALPRGRARLGLDIVNVLICSWSRSSVIFIRWSRQTYGPPRAHSPTRGRALGPGRAYHWEPRPLTRSEPHPTSPVPPCVPRSGPPTRCGRAHAAGSALGAAEAPIRVRLSQIETHTRSVPAVYPQARTSMYHG